MTIVSDKEAATMKSNLKNVFTQDMTMAVNVNKAFFTIDDAHSFIVGRGGHLS